MQDSPTAQELIEAVQKFLQEKAMVELKGISGFHARVAFNALGIVARELDLGPKALHEEAERLSSLLGREAPLAELNQELCEKIEAGELGLETPGLIDHLKKTTLDKVAIDQPKYKAYQIAREEWTN